jgi:phosphoribosylglycinamide formyltransferase-1
VTDKSIKKSIVVLVSGNGSNLQAIIDHVAQQKINANVSAVIANVSGAYGLTRAEDAGIPAELIEHKNFASREEYDAKIMACIDKYNPDLIVLAGFMRILTPQFVEHFKGKMLNIHPSLLPKYKGLDTHQRAIAAGDTEHGASVHFVTAELDGGPVILQSKVPVFEQQDADELAQRVQQQERQMYPLVIKWFCEDRLKMIQNQAVLDDNILDEKGYAIG